MITIGLNGQNLFIDDPAGPEKFTWHLYHTLAKTDLTNKYVIYVPSAPEPSNYHKLTDGNPNFRYKVIPRSPSYTQIGLAIELLKHPVDVFFTPIHTLPGIKKPSQKTVSMLHGFEWQTNDQYKHKPLHKLIHPLILWWVQKFSNVVVTPSEATKAKARYAKVVKVIHEGVESMFYKRNEAEIKKVINKYNLQQPYLLFLSTIQPRKNLLKTLDAFKLLARPELTFAIAGKPGWEYEPIMEKINSTQNVTYLGRVPDEDRPGLLSGAEAYVNFSLDEGFGLPLAEAMACQTKCVVSDIAAHKEIGGNYAIYANPNDLESMVHGLKTSKPDLPPKKYSWEKTAKEFIALFQELSETPRV